MRDMVILKRHQSIYQCDGDTPKTYIPFIIFYFIFLEYYDVIINYI